MIAETLPSVALYPHFVLVAFVRAQLVVGDTFAKWNEMNTLMNHNENYKNYRAVVATIDAPCVPFMGVLTRDLVMIEEGNADWSTEAQDGGTPETPVPNVAKMLMITNALRTNLLRFKAHRYEIDISVDPLMGEFLEFLNGNCVEVRAIDEL